MATITIKNLRLRTIIGIEEAERTNKQDIIINVAIEVDTAQAAQSDHIDDAFNYKTITKRIIHFVEGSSFYLLEKLVEEILQFIMLDDQVLSATVEIDKPAALRFADSVSLKQTVRR